MNRLRASWPWVALFAAALGVGLLTGAGAVDSPTPSVTNAGPKGARVLHTWLTEGGGRVETISQPLTSLPSGLEVVVIAAPITRTITEEEVSALEEFVEAGGLLVYLAPRPPRSQPELQRWLKLSESPIIGADTAPLGDQGGLSVRLSPERGAEFPGVSQLRVSADTTITVGADDAVPVAGSSLWIRPLGKGQVWIGAGADLLENRRLELLDNLQLWANLRGKRIAFDEFHHGVAAAAPWSANLWATLFQFVFVALLFVAARAPRLGPARATLARAHRSSLEYVASMGALMRRAGVEGELKLQLRERLRRLMQTRLGIPMTLSADEASRALATSTGLAADVYLQLDDRLTTQHTDFPTVAAEAARVEDVVVGRRG